MRRRCHLQNLRLRAHAVDSHREHCVRLQARNRRPIREKASTIWAGGWNRFRWS
jgi:hypothetical protein